MKKKKLEDLLREEKEKGKVLEDLKVKLRAGKAEIDRVFSQIEKIWE